MKNFSVKFMLTCLMGMITALYAFYQSTNQDQIMISIWLFFTFGVSGVAVMLFREGLK